ncbi:MFS general substrate transporter, partial [Leucogyrophana mollusca]
SFFIRALALLCACSLSVGSHYASYTLGPLKSRLSRELGTSNTEFSLLISAFSLNSTWTPLVGGLMASKLGTTVTSLLATGVIFAGQALLLIGEMQEDVRLMAFGLFVFGLGVSPLAVVQESIIVRFFKSHGLGVSMALGLVAGKGASFVSARTSYPLSERYGRHAPFYASTILTAFSFIINIIYLFASKWLVRGSGTVLEASELEDEARRRSVYSLSEAQALERVARKRRVNLADVPKLGDVFWAYIGINVLCGTLWSPFTHLAANILEKRYDLSESNASTQASYLLAGSIVLYPLCGFAVDHIKHPQAVIRLFMLTSVLTMLCYTWLALPPSWTKSPSPAVASFASGIGFSPCKSAHLLLVVIVPQIVPLKYVSTTLGVHKSLEQTGSTIFQTLAGLLLDSSGHQTSPPGQGVPRITSAIQHLLNIFVFLNALHIFSIVGLAVLDGQRRRRVSATGFRRDSAIDVGENSDGGRDEIPSAIGPLPSTSSAEQRKPLLPKVSTLASDPSYSGSESLPSPSNAEGYRRISLEVWRGRIFARMCVILVCFAWVLFLSTAWLKLRSRDERG